MSFLKNLLAKQEKYFEKGSKLERLYPLYEAVDTLFYSPATVTEKPSHVRDALDLKRMMGIVVFALMPCILMAMYNTGLQANLALDNGLESAGWRTDIVAWLGVGFSPESILACFIHGAMYFIPVLAVTFAVGGTIEVIFAVVRKHEVNEGFFVTGPLFALILPASIPLWQVALGIAFGVIIGKEVFGGTGMNILNPALTSRAFLFFAYPAQISGDAVWVAVDGFSGPTMLAQAAGGGKADLLNSDWSWMDAFLGFIPGSMGETSALACLIGAILLIVTGIGSWRTMLGVTIGTIVTALLLNAVAGKVDNPYFNVPFWWHFVLGGWALGTVFMATDPVSSPFTDKGQWIYGILIGFLVVLIRVVNPAYPEGMMLAILFMNVFAATIDHVVVQGNIKRRLERNAATA
ncbi:MAG: NADH:ubiquinone reductase (Na(+)-transporting) subunit B [Planctomycetota bacterium]|jgi:Na+-transporting NADH:ubiquinone oxidoreductase subunit B